MAAFTWKVADKGYEWADVFFPGSVNDLPYTPDLASEALGMRTCLVPIEWTFREYEPMKKQMALFRTFGTTPTTPEAIRAFANEFGHLGEGRVGEDSPRVYRFQDGLYRSANNLTVHFSGILQPIQEWSAAIVEMRTALRLWDSVRDGRGNKNDGRKLQEIVDCQLGEVRIIPRFEFIRSPSREPTLHLVPNSLAGAMWMQLANAVVGDKKYRACESCGRWFELSPEAFRMSKHYCKEACRSRAYRARKDRARQLHADGKTRREIAKILESNIATITQWIAH